MMFTQAAVNRHHHHHNLNHNHNHNHHPLPQTTTTKQQHITSAFVAELSRDLIADALAAFQDRHFPGR